MTGVCIGLKPQSIEDITAIIALYRPGPMDSIPRFIACKHNPEKITYKHPSLVPILSMTYGCIVYQEQVIQIFQQLAGYSLGQADMVRRAMSKKKVKEIEKERGAFLHGDPERGITGCVQNGVPEDVAQSIYNEIYDFANYAFNKAHAVCYAVVAYQTAWFKRHHPKEYMAALLTSVLDSSDKVAEYTGECRAMGIQLLPPDVNESDADFTVVGDGLRFGLVAVKGVGRGLIQNLLEERNRGGPFPDFVQFCDRMFGLELNRRALENLIKCGAFDHMGCRRSQLLEVFGQVLDGVAASRKRNVEGQMDLFGGLGGEEPESLPALHLPDIPEVTPKARMAMEKETTGLYLSGHPMDAYRETAREQGAAPIGSILGDFGREDGPKQYYDNQRLNIAGVIAKYRTRTTRNNTLMGYVTLEDSTGEMELLCFARVLEQNGSLIRENNPVLAVGRISVRDEKEPQLVVDELKPLGEDGVEPKAPAQRLYLRLPSREGPLAEKVKLVLSFFPGEDGVVIYYTDIKKQARGRCLIHPALLEDLRERLGEENVVMK